MERVKIFEHAKTLCNNPFPPTIEYEPTEIALGYWLQEAKERGEREQRLKEALETIKELSERDGISFYLDRCYIEARDVLSTLYLDTPAPKEGE